MWKLKSELGPRVSDAQLEELKRALEEACPLAFMSAEEESFCTDFRKFSKCVTRFELSIETRRVSIQNRGRPTVKF